MFKKITIILFILIFLTKLSTQTIYSANECTDFSFKNESGNDRLEEGLQEINYSFKVKDDQSRYRVSAWKNVSWAWEYKLEHNPPYQNSIVSGKVQRNIVTFSPFNQGNYRFVVERFSTNQWQPYCESSYIIYPSSAPPTNWFRCNINLSSTSGNKLTSSDDIYANTDIEIYPRATLAQDFRIYVENQGTVNNDDDYLKRIVNPQVIQDTNDPEHKLKIENVNLGKWTDGQYIVHLRFKENAVAAFSRCYQVFEVCDNCSVPTPGPSLPPGTVPSPTLPPKPDKSALCNSVTDLNQQIDCVKCVGGKAPDGVDYQGTGVYTALGCIKTDIAGFVSNLFTIGLGLAGGTALLFLIYGGFLVLTSGGNPETIQHGKEILTSAIAGLLLIIFSVFIIQLVAVDILKIPGFEKENSGSSAPVVPPPTNTPVPINTPVPNPTSTPGPAVTNTPTPTATPTPTLPPSNSQGLSINLPGANPADPMPKFNPNEIISVEVNGLTSFSWNTLVIVTDKDGQKTDCKQLLIPQFTTAVTTPNTPSNAAAILVLASYKTCTDLSELNDSIATIQAAKAIYLKP